MLVCGLVSSRRAFADCSFGLPIHDWPWMICRCRLEVSTLSSSTMPMVPMPAAARYRAIGEPSPPAPMHRTDESFSFCWPADPTSGRVKCLA